MAQMFPLKDLHSRLDLWERRIHEEFNEIITQAGELLGILPSLEGREHVGNGKGPTWSFHRPIFPEKASEWTVRISTLLGNFPSASSLAFRLQTR
jgi:hypothetical protein